MARPFSLVKGSTLTIGFFLVHKSVCRLEIIEFTVALHKFIGRISSWPNQFSLFWAFFTCASNRHLPAPGSFAKYTFLARSVGILFFSLPYLFNFFQLFLSSWLALLFPPSMLSAPCYLLLLHHPSTLHPSKQHHHEDILLCLSFTLRLGFSLCPRCQLSC